MNLTKSHEQNDFVETLKYNISKIIQTQGFCLIHRKFKHTLNFENPISINTVSKCYQKHFFFNFASEQ
jgi:hypothetical protein